VEYVGGQEMQAGDWAAATPHGMCVFHGRPFQKGIKVQGAEILDISPPSCTCWAAGPATWTARC